MANEGRDRRESRAHGESSAALCHSISARNPPRLSWRWRCPISLPLSDMIRSRPDRRWKTPTNPALRAPGTAPEGAEKGAFEDRRGVGKRRAKRPCGRPPLSSGLARACGPPHLQARWAIRPEAALFRRSRERRRGGRRATRRGPPRCGRPALPCPSRPAASTTG